MTEPSKRIAYLFSRYPVVSQTFCDSEMLELETQGVELTIASLNPPGDLFRHERHSRFRGDVLYPPTPAILKAREALFKETDDWDEKLEPMIEAHDEAYGIEHKAATRARNAIYFAREFERRRIEHIHIHFANRATQTALFIKKLSGIPFSFTAHAQDFMVDLGSDDLLREMCREAEFVIAVSEWSCRLLKEKCAESSAKIHRVYNGIQLDEFPSAKPASPGPLKMVSIGRLIEFKGFHHLIGACKRLKDRGIPFECTIVGDGPLHDDLLRERDDEGLEAEIDFAGIKTQEEVKELLAESHVFVLPCIVDSKGASDILPTVIMEAMAVSLPIVSTLLVGVPEMVEHKKTGLLVQPTDEDALADALAGLAEDPELRARLGKQGKLLAHEKFERKNTARELSQQFEMVETRKWDSAPFHPRVAYLVEQWPCQSDPLLMDELNYLTQHHADDILIIACSSPPKVSPEEMDLETQQVLSSIEYLPDGMVLESNWRHDKEAVDQITKLRSEFDGGVSTERFFLEARRALQIAMLLSKRKIGHLHAARSNTILSAWLAKCVDSNGMRFSFAAEEDALLDSKALQVVEKDACLVSRADEKDLLNLKRPPMRRLKVGRLKVRLGRPGVGDRIEVYENWVKRLFGV